MRNVRIFFLVCFTCLALFSNVYGQKALIDFSDAVIVTPQNPSPVQQKSIQVMVEEVEKRTLIHLKVSYNWPESAVPVIAIGPIHLADQFSGAFSTRIPSDASSRPAEGFLVFVDAKTRTAPTAMIFGNDDRGILFGVGYLLRQMRMSMNKIFLPEELNLDTAPKYPLRGHQLGYRPKTNSYDGFTIEMWEQYIRDLTIFGTNAIELIPPRSDDAADSPHFPLPQMEMMIKMSQVLDDYGLDVWIWYPALDADYSDPATVEFALDEWEKVFQQLPRIDAVFVPGGDPGHTQPKHLLNLLKKQTDVLHRHHPQAEMWVSPQSFNREWFDEFYQILQKELPNWLTGVVFGPQIRVSLPELRENIPDKYPIRRYPDITHSIHCQYPVPDWDVAFALTENREVINPRPIGEAVIFRILEKYAPYGFLTYSEGVNDDVNKIIWSGLGWNSQNVIDILREYSRYFIGSEYTEDFAQGLLSLERNWQGPLLTNEFVYTTLKQFQTMEENASPQDLLNWRFQLALYRAYYDAYLRSRLVFETKLEEEAMESLRNAKKIGTLIALGQAESILDKADIHKVAKDWRARTFELAEALYQSIRMQLSVHKYKAISVRRGANLDLIDFPLNNRVWIKNRLMEIRKHSGEDERLEEIKKIINWTNPGPGGFYNDLGNLTCQPQLVRGPGFENDPAFLQSSLVGFGTSQDRRMSWHRHAGSLNDAPLKMRYTDLDPNSQYKVRIVYAGDNFRTKIRLVADDKMAIHPYIEKPRPIRPVEFDVPVEATSDGLLTLTWYRELGLGGNGRGCQVAEVWLMKK